MAINQTDLDALPDLTDAGLLKATRQAIVSITLTGTARTINGRSLTTANLADLREQMKDLEARIAAADGTGSVAYVQFDDPR